METQPQRLSYYRFVGRCVAHRINGRVVTSVALDYDFSPASTIVDIGGGRGHLLSTVLDAYPQISKGILFDLPDVVGSQETKGSYKLPTVVFLMGRRGCYYSLV